MHIESIKIENFKVFKSVHIKNLPNMCVFLGANGSGKTTLFDVFGFLKDCLVHNVKQALAKRGGFKEVVSRDSKGPMSFEIKFRLTSDGPLTTYMLEIGLRDGMPLVEREILRYRRGPKGRPWTFLDFKSGQGMAITNEADYGSGALEIREEQKLDSPDILAIKGLGQFERFQAASAFRKMIENWYVSDFHINVSRESQDAGFAEHLSTQGENLPLVAQYMYQNHRDEFDKVLMKMRKRVPGVTNVQATETEDGRIVLKFSDGAFKDPFIARYVSDGTIKMFAYLLLLHDPSPHPLLAIEEPENQLHPDLLRELAEEFHQYASRGGQVFISTHSPDFVNGIQLDQLFWLTKTNGYTEITRASDNELLVSLNQQGDLPGAMWKQQLFAGAGPR
ncbi:MAG: AAA family ATPase [Armatimonadota bacterium]